LYNKQLSNQLLQRQQEIMTRMLESEKAERKQEQDQKREAEQAKEKPAATPPNFEQYIKQKNKEKELLETIPVEMQPYYQEKTKEYFKKIGSQ
jgi:membrane carboxypeptidase/penicillin-binding protein PbpC